MVTLPQPVKYVMMEPVDRLPPVWRACGRFDPPAQVKQFIWGFHLVQLCPGGIYKSVKKVLDPGDWYTLKNQQFNLLNFTL